MSAVLEAHEPSAKYLSALQPKLVQHFELLGTAPGGVAKLRELILMLAVQGKLVPQDPKDEPASALLRQIRAEKDRLIAEGKVKREKALPAIAEKEEPFALPSGWEWVRLGTLLPFRIGKTPPSKDPQYWGDEGHAWVSISDMTHFGDVFDTSRKITAKGANVFGYEPLPAGTLIMSFKLTIGKISVLRLPAYHNEAIVSLMPLAGLRTDFLKYVLPTVSKTGASKDALMGATLNTESLSNLLIALPPLAEQSRIVTRVEELMRLCDALETQGQLEAAQHAQLVQTLLGALTTSDTPDELADNWQRVATHFDLLLDRPEAVDALEQTILQLAVRGLLVPQDPSDEPASVLLQKIRAEKYRLVVEGKIKRDKPHAQVSLEEMPFSLPAGWSWVRLSGIWQSSFYGPRFSNEEYVSKGGIPTIRTTDMTDSQIVLRTPPLVNVPLTKYDAYLVKKGDLLVTRSGSIGVMALFDLDIDAVPSAYLIRIRFSEHVLPEFCLKYFLSELGQKQLGLSTTAVGVPNVSASKMAEFVFPLPPLAEQSRIVAHVESLRRLCADVRQRLAARQTTQAHLADALVASVNT
jgi:type I restriction enzyme S subunit